MGKLSPEKTRDSSVNALKVVYYVIVGLAVTEALHRTFIRDGLFVGWECFRSNNLTAFLLLLALLPTICRFVHGASLHLDSPSKKHLKPLWDFIGFFFQGSLFYLMALSLQKPMIFSSLFILMLSGDSVWLLLLMKIRYIELGSVEKQWLLSDLCIIVFLFLVFLARTLIRCLWQIEEPTANLLSAIAILFIATVATYKDYHSNRDFFFPSFSDNTDD